MANINDYRYSEQLARLRRAQELISQAEAELTQCLTYERQHHATGVDEYVDARIVVQNAHALVANFAAAVSSLADMESK
jgi:hypothetical protein